jgi:hypothetical protein
VLVELVSVKTNIKLSVFDYSPLATDDPVDAAGSGSNFQSKTKPSRSSLRRKRKSASTFSNRKSYQHFSI